MREIKFRAFDEGNKIMHYDFQFIKSGDEGNDWIIFTSDKNKLSNKPSPLQNPYFSQQLKIMQYTGLKDVDEKEIYEGDVVEIKFNEYYSDDNITIEEDSIDIYKVIFENGCFFFKSKSKYYLPLYALDNIDVEIKILSNIYENKELLECKE